MHEENKKNFLEELRALDEATKGKMMIVITLIFMVGVVYLWFGYFNGLVTSIPQAAMGSEQVQQGNGQSWIAVIGDGFAGGMRWLYGVAKTPGQYNIQPQK